MGQNQTTDSELPVLIKPIILGRCTTDLSQQTRFGWCIASVRASCHVGGVGSFLFRLFFLRGSWGNLILVVSLLSLVLCGNTICEWATNLRFRVLTSVGILSVGTLLPKRVDWVLIKHTKTGDIRIQYLLGFLKNYEIEILAKFSKNLSKLEFNLY
jgi:hypothetical protein